VSPLDHQGNWIAPDAPRPDASVASGPRGVTGGGPSFNSGAADSLEAVLTISAVVGTNPTLDVYLETSIDGGTTWDTVSTFPQKVGVGTDGHVFGPLGDVCRWRWTVGGTVGPSFTFAIDVEANN
jgi:hypothetical protein